jgi:hypothetical protein
MSPYSYRKILASTDKVHPCGAVSRGSAETENQTGALILGQIANSLEH